MGLLDPILNRPADRLLEKGLELARTRHEAIANNLANVDTPGYKRKDVDFASVFAAELSREARGTSATGGAESAPTLALARTHAKHLPGVARADGGLNGDVRLVEDGSTSFRVDGNNVDIDAEMAKLAENTIYYQAVAQQIDRRFRMTLAVVDEGRR